MLGVTYLEGSIERRLLEDDPDALAQVARWVAVSLASPRFWSLRSVWPDLCQEVIARLVQSLKEARFDPSRDLRTYVQGIAGHVAIQATARRARENVTAVRVSAVPDPGPDPDRLTINRMIARRVLDQSTEDCRRLIHAYFFEDLSYEEIARSMNVPIGTVKSRLFRCMEAAYLFLEGRVRLWNRPGLPKKGEKTEAPE
jgi:RNA polymerase sigma-70 factor, ECF subfamily